MSDKPLGILFASRAFESPHIEGGFLLLRDLALSAGSDDGIEASCFSTGAAQVTNNLELLPVYSRHGWGLRQSLQFMTSLSAAANRFDIVHTAHVPTPTNTCVLRYIRNKASGAGTKFVQTVTALPASELIRSRSFWGDAIVCLNEQVAAVARAHHDNVSVIPPVPSPERLKQHQALPGDLEERMGDRKIVCIAVDLGRLADGFDLAAVCDTLLRTRDDAAVVMACRFGEERLAERQLATLSSQYSDRLIVLGQVDYMLGLLKRSSVLFYPIDDIDKKFNPPMIVLESVMLGTRVVTSASVDVRSILGDTDCHGLRSSDIGEWVDALQESLDSAQDETCPLVGFDDVYLEYLSIYRDLRKHRA